MTICIYICMYIYMGLYADDDDDDDFPLFPTSPRKTTPRRGARKPGGSLSMCTTNTKAHFAPAGLQPLL